jgi:IS30 family transposase
MGGRHLTDEEKRAIRELYVSGVHMNVIAERFRCNPRTVYVYSLACGDREFSVFRNGEAHNGKRGRKRREKYQQTLPL